MAVSSKEGQAPAWMNAFALVVCLLAGAVVFLPFALDTSPWDAVTLRVPDNQGNWWHALVGSPFFLAFPMIWLRLRSLFSERLPTLTGRCLIWIAAGLSACGTISVQVPFLLHLAGTSEWQRLSVLGVGFGIVVTSAILLFSNSRVPCRSAALNAAYLANAALCPVVYGAARGTVWSRSG
jgi:hypothetical protein